MTRLVARPFVSSLLAIGAIAAMAPVSATAQSPGRPLPAFALTAPDGSVISSQALPQSQPWILVIAQRPCPSCDATFAVLDAVISQERAARVVVVLAGASAAEAVGVRARYAGLSQAAWYRDVTKASLPALGVGGSPVVVGLSGGQILWTRTVAAMSAGDLESLVTSWIR